MARSRSRSPRSVDRSSSRKRDRDEDHKSLNGKGEDYERKRRRSRSRSRSRGRDRHESRDTPVKIEIKPEIERPKDEEEEEAERIARIAVRAEAKAAARNGGINGNGVKQPLSMEELMAKKKEDVPEIQFLTKKQREALALQKLQERRGAANGGSSAMGPPSSSRDRERERREQERLERERRERELDKLRRLEAKEQREREKELQQLKDYYLGKKEVKKRVVKPSEKFARIFQFEWEPTEDTSKDLNPLYQQRLEVAPLFGRGYVAGVDMREQRKNNKYLEALTLKRLEEDRRMEMMAGLSKSERQYAEEERKSLVEDLRRRREDDIKDMEKATIGLIGKHWREKKLEDMTERDWRIFREDFDMQIRGVKNILPLRSWTEATLHKEVMMAIKDNGWTEPSPIQRAALPIGLGRRDIIGIAETGSGKTGAFAIPMITYCLSLPEAHRDRTPEEGPLAVVMAPTRELAEQIGEDVAKLIKYTELRWCAGVGGKPIEDQGFLLRKGIDILVGTPGRLKDLIESRYLVLNQCNYIVLDEADRMVDMGFEDEVVTVMEAMGGLLKSEVEEEADQQAEEAKVGHAIYRVTAMFSATMPPAVERIARHYLRHPAIVKIGDQDSGKNKRIEQRVVYTTETAKRNLILDLLRNARKDDKFILFVNAKRACDALARVLEGAHIECAILHGGKSQDQREASLQAFRDGDFQVLVATDVAARGLDITDVTHVVNYDMPNKIDSYCHRIGRTGRAGKEGIATTYITENDSEVFYDLKAYLESTEMRVPSELANHAASKNPAGARGEDGKLKTGGRDSVVYAKK